MAVADDAYPGTKHNGTSVCSLYLLEKMQGSRLTFQLASPVASDRFDSLAKTNFSLARHLISIMA